MYLRRAPSWAELLKVKSSKRSESRSNNTVVSLYLSPFNHHTFNHPQSIWLLLPLSSCICVFYSTLTVIKLFQWVIHYASIRQGCNPNIYNPSFAVFSALANVIFLGGQTELRLVPRKTFQSITDRWLKAYTQAIQEKTRKPKTFHHLSDALNDSFREFCQETTAFYVPFMKYTSMNSLNQPLGFCSLASMIAFIVVIPFLMVREYSLGGNALTALCKVSYFWVNVYYHAVLFLKWCCTITCLPINFISLGARYYSIWKVAVSSTSNNLYVVCCKEGISCKYPWISGVFERPQRHPMIGRAVCSMYERKIVLPNNDKMDFDIELLPNTCGTLVIRQTYPSRLQSWWKMYFPARWSWPCWFFIYYCRIHGLKPWRP